MGIIDEESFFFLEVLKDLFLLMIYKTSVFIKLLKQMIEYLYNYLCFFIFFSGVYVFVSLRKYLLSILLSLEFIILSVFFSIILFLVLNRYESYILILFLVFIVCEGSLGLSILVMIIRTHGNNYFQSFNVLC